MQTLIANKDKIFEIKRKVEEKDPSLYDLVTIPNIPITEKTITIVMTACNRSKQTYFTLKTIQNSSHKAIQVIIVDDSDMDPISKEGLEKYPFYIDFITIKKENKNWVNPVVNYNIGFGYIKGSKVVIQNAEVCHVGDGLEFMYNKITDNNYYVCDVKATKSLKENEIIYKSNTNTIDIYNKSLYIHWYQGRVRQVNYHFLTAMTIDTFNKIKEFSYDYSFGISYDDNDFLLKIISNNINVINLFHDKYKFGGIHLWHSSIMKKSKKIENNKNIFINKEKYYKEIGEYIDFYSKNNINFSKIDEINLKIKPSINLLDLQNLFIQLKNEKIINFYIDKKDLSSNINSFRKCILKGYCYKNSSIKIPKNLSINFHLL